MDSQKKWIRHQFRTLKKGSRQFRTLCLVILVSHLRAFDKLFIPCPAGIRKMRHFAAGACCYPGSASCQKGLNQVWPFRGQKNKIGLFLTLVGFEIFKNLLGGWPFLSLYKLL